jgi:tetratricopeptide (TPR) repeat protein
LEGISKPLRRLQEEGAWFARAKEVRLLWVRADTSARSTVLTLVERLEYHADNRSPFILLDDPWSGPDFGSRARALRFSERFAIKAGALRQAGIELGPFAAAEPARSGLEAFAARLALAAAALRAPLDGLVVVLAPVRISAPEAFLSDVHALVTAPGLEVVRWIVVEADSEHLLPLLAELGERSLTVDARFDESAQQEDLAAIAGPPPPPSAPLEPPFPWGPWSSGGAMPAGAPPRRKDDSLAPSDDQLSASGLNPLYVKGGAQRLKQLMLGAALALRQQRFADAIELQARAADLCEGLALHEPHAIQRLVLAGYLLAAAEPAAARMAYERVVALAHREKLATQEVQAELGLGMLDALERRPSALTHYTNAARVAEAAGTLPLAIECRRMAGQCASDQGVPDLAVEHWQHALALAERLPPETQRATSAADIARLLAQLLAAYGEGARAAELQRHAFRIEHGVEPGPVPVSPAAPPE